MMIDRWYWKSMGLLAAVVVVDEKKMVGLLAAVAVVLERKVVVSPVAMLTVVAGLCVH
jgi:hypothetical protein